MPFYKFLPTKKKQTPIKNKAHCAEHSRQGRVAKSRNPLTGNH